MKYFTKEEVLEVVRLVESQDYWNTDEMETLIKMAEKESEDFDPSQYEDPDWMYEEMLKILEVSKEDLEEEPMKKENGCAGLLYLLYQRECAEISAECVAEGYPSHGSNYDLRTSGLWEEYYEEWYSEAKGYC